MTTERQDLAERPSGSNHLAPKVEDMYRWKGR